MKIAAAQLNSNDNVEENFKTVASFVTQASENQAQIVFFPENTLFFRIGSEQKIVPLRLEGIELKKLSQLALQNHIAIHLTTPIIENEQVSNASILIDELGQIQILYKKIHLFDISLQGQKPIRESDNFISGQNPKVFNFQNFKWGSTICYDLRFSELFHYYAVKEVDVILVPSAFLVKTGQAHWEPLLRARAIESQCYIVAPAQGGEHTSKQTSETRQTYGHTLIIDPWGEIISQKQEGIGLVFAELDIQKILRVRQQIPMKEHRRLKS